MAVTAGGDPCVGSNTFAIDVKNAPGGTFAALFLGLGSCGPGISVSCGQFYAFPPALGPLIAPVLGAGCSGKASFLLPIPPIAALCGLKLCLQCLIVCPSSTGPAGLGMSNALEFNITTG